MAITDMPDPNTMIGAPVHSTDGEVLGKIESIYNDNRDEPTGVGGDKDGSIPRQRFHHGAVWREEVTVEREPITDANRAEAMSDADLSEEEHEVTLSEQQVVVDKETVPVERVRLGTETATEPQHVDETIREDQIETGVEPGVRRRDEN